MKVLNNLEAQLVAGSGGIFANGGGYSGGNFGSYGGGLQLGYGPGTRETPKEFLTTNPNDSFTPYPLEGPSIAIGAGYGGNDYFPTQITPPQYNIGYTWNF